MILTKGQGVCRKGAQAQKGCPGAERVSRCRKGAQVQKGYTGAERVHRCSYGAQVQKGCTGAERVHRQLWNNFALCNKNIVFWGQNSFPPNRKYRINSKSNTVII